MPIGHYLITENTNFDTVDKVEAHYGGNWEKIEAGRFLEAADSTIENVAAGLPNITATFGTDVRIAGANLTGAFYSSNTRSNSYTGYDKESKSIYDVKFDASRSNSIYGASTTVQPKSRRVYMYKRIA